MIWGKIILSLILFTVQLSGKKAKFDVEKEIQISCISSEYAKEFTTFELKYNPDMATHNYTFDENMILNIEELVGDREKIIFFFLGHEDKLYSLSGKSFLIAREQMIKNSACTCTVSYAFLDGSNLVKYWKYFSVLKKRLPKVVNMMTTFIQNIVDSSDFKINLSSVYLTGFCLGGHIAGHVGYELRKIYNGQMVSAIWAFDPPKIGFPYPEKEGKPRRVQKFDAEFVVVFHTSRLGVKKSIADVDIVVNGGRDQPSCQNETLKITCNHYAAYLLRELIAVNSKKLEKNENGSPVAYKVSDISEKFAIEITRPAWDKAGIFGMRVGL
ncbi:phospholipase A1-like [Contarinia nasturtii]|uniref:phospholipase A1-like n=1 Tax=Contarinia nasturtii TaxID=265458 RepID=UPI0012D4C28A|nr:phospholipase A1-like [Contarinia nasturtii]